MIKLLKPHVYKQTKQINRLSKIMEDSIRNTRQRKMAWFWKLEKKFCLILSSPDLSLKAMNKIKVMVIPP